MSRQGPHDHQDSLLVLDMDGVVVTAQPGGRRTYWYERLRQDLAIDPALLQERFFEPHWDAVVRGGRGLLGTLAPVLERINPGVSAEALISYWFRHDSRVDQQVLAFAGTWVGAAPAGARG
jgi:putative hydrolase of the HAD superfamily